MLLQPEVRSARRALERLLHRTAWTGDVDAALIAVQEALINAERHGDGLREVKFGFDGDTLLVEVADQSASFNADAYLRRAPDLMSERGRGLWLIGCLSTEVQIVEEPEGARVRLTFCPDDPAVSPSGEGTVDAPKPRAAAPDELLLPALEALGRDVLDTMHAVAVLTDGELVIRAVVGDLEWVPGVDAVDAVGRDARTFTAIVKHLMSDPVAFEDRLYRCYAHLDEPSSELFAMADGGMLERRSGPVVRGGKQLGHLAVYVVHDPKSLAGALAGLSGEA